uniref:tyrosine--tRNA ligase 1, cytoplasmic-like n=1 Tax=Erigeron canadensis TaxID=72917 RepID=UPI001CB8EFC8|nr:tyrosine--tRNA ligase 1, cytoplasmic-like [Erigeron canadensis]
MDVDLLKIRDAGDYSIEVLKAAGMNLGDNMELIRPFNEIEEIEEKANDYWSLVIDIARRNQISEIKKSGQIMGQSKKDGWIAGQIIYICMQCAYIFFFEADICQIGMDQQTVNALERKFCHETKRKNKPIMLSHHVLPSLLNSDPSSVIYMDDDEATVEKKIGKAYCPSTVQGNPCLQYIKYIVFPWFNEVKVEREEKNGGEKDYTSCEELFADYEKGLLHPGDLKPALWKAINTILQPVREHFKNDKDANKLLMKVKSHLDSEKRGMSLKDLSSPLNHPNSTTEMCMEKKFNLVRSIGEECIEDGELRELLTNKPRPISYDGFEPSGRMHIAQGVMKTINVNKLTSAGCKVKIWIADWFALLNDKMGGDLEKIEVVGKYFIETWKGSAMNLDNVEFIWSSKEINRRAVDYWPLVLDIARRNTLSRITKCCKIMGRNDKNLTLAQIFYPCMQCADIFFLEADICQLGNDQRKVNVLAREYCKEIKKENKPVILSHHMLSGLLEGQSKMSKSNPNSAIFMEDEEAEIVTKINNAYCPPNVVEENPCLEYIKYIVFPWFNEFKVEGKEISGGERSYRNFPKLLNTPNDVLKLQDICYPVFMSTVDFVDDFQPILSFSCRWSAYNTSCAADSKDDFFSACRTPQSPGGLLQVLKRTARLIFKSLAGKA